MDPTSMAKGEKGGNNGVKRYIIAIEEMLDILEHGHPCRRYTWVLGRYEDILLISVALTGWSFCCSVNAHKEPYLILLRQSLIPPSSLLFAPHGLPHPYLMQSIQPCPAGYSNICWTEVDEVCSSTIAGVRAGMVD